MNAKTQAKTLRKRFVTSGQLDVYEVADTLGLDIYIRCFQASELDEIIVGTGIAISRDLDGPTQRWAIAHAIGHAVMHGKECNAVWLRMDTMLTDKFEHQAEEFAFWLLVDLNEAQVEEISVAGEIAEHFGVPVEAILRWLD